MDIGIPILVIIIGIIIGILFRDGCNSREELKDFQDQISNFQLKEQGFKKTINKQGEEIAEQKQIILTKDQAIQQGLIENTELRKIKSQVSINTNTVLDTIFIPFDVYLTENNFDNEETIDWTSVIKVPKSFSRLNEWYTIKGKIIKTGIELDSIRFFNRLTITIGQKKKKGLRNIFKRSIPLVEVINESPYVSVGGLQNIIIKKKPKRWYQTTFFKIAVGFALGTYTTIRIGKSTK